MYLRTNNTGPGLRRNMLLMVDCTFDAIDYFGRRRYPPELRAFFDQPLDEGTVGVEETGDHCSYPTNS